MRVSRLFAAAAFAVPALSACTQMGGPGQGGGPMWGMPYGGLSGLLILVIVVAVAVPLLRGQRRDGGRDEDPLVILKRRYAKGEINREEYERMRKELGDG